MLKGALGDVGVCMCVCVYATEAMRRCGLFNPRNGRKSMFYRNLAGSCGMQNLEKTGFSIGSQTSYLGGIAPKGHCCLDDRTILTFSSPF
jgi:hypothetical protein